MAVEAVEVAPAVEETAHNAELPDWKRRCISTYAECKDDDWTESVSAFIQMTTAAAPASCTPTAREPR